MSDWTLRPGDASDIDAVVHLASELPQWFSERGRQHVAIDLHFQKFFVAESESSITGFVSFYVAEAVAWIGWLGVRPTAHRSGIGRALIARLAEQLAPANITTIRTDTLGDSVDYEPYARTRAFYYGVGFVEHARRMQDDPEWPERLTLRLDLGGSENAPDGRT